MSSVALTACNTRPPLRRISIGLRRSLIHTRRGIRPDELSRTNVGQPFAKFALPRSTERATSFSGEFPENLEERYVASFNWMNNVMVPIIAVPGVPPILKRHEVQLPLLISEPSTSRAEELKGRFKPKGEHSISPTPPLFSPLFAAADVMKTSIDWPAIDVIASVSALRLLITAVTARDSLRKPFSFWAQRVGSENSGAVALWPVREGMAGSEAWNQPEGLVARARAQLTAAPLGNNYYRVVQTDLFDLKMLVTAPVAACAVKESSLSQDTLHPPSESALDLQHGLCVVQAGNRVPQSSLADITLDPNLDALTLPPRKLTSLFLAGIPTFYHGLLSYPKGAPNAELTTLSSFDLRSEKGVRFRASKADVFDALASTLASVRDAICGKAVGGNMCVVRVDGTYVFVSDCHDGPSLVPEGAKARFG